MTTRLLDPFEPSSLPAGKYVASSTSDAYGSLLAAITLGHAEFLGESLEEDGVVSTAAVVRHGRRNPDDTGWETGEIGFSEEYYQKVLKEYTSGWREMWWREAIQNSVDSGAYEIDAMVTHNEDGTYTISAEDNGSGMSREILTGKFLQMGGSTKLVGSGSTGGFGKAKELLLFPWLSWRLHTNDLVVEGFHRQWKIRPAPRRRGTILTVVMPGDQTTTVSSFVTIVTKSFLPGIRFQATETYKDGTVNKTKPKAKLAGEELIEQVTGKLDIFATDIEGESGSLYVRVNGIYMFSTWLTTPPGKQIIAEITGPSTEILTSNREGFSDWQTRSTIDALTERFTKNTKSAIDAKKGLVRKKYIGAGRFKAKEEERQIQADVLSQITAVPPTEDGFTEMSPSDIGSIAEVMDLLAQRTHTTYVRSGSTNKVGGVSTPDGPLAAELLRSVEFTGAHHVQEAVRQLVWSPDFLVENKIEKFKIPPKFMPETMKPQVVKLARTWTELCRYVLMQLGSFRPFGVGFIFSHSIAAAYEKDEDGEEWLLLNPYTSPRAMESTWTPTNFNDLKKLYAYAIHEATHFASGAHDHDEDFAAALTNNIATASDGFRKIRRIAGKIRMSESAVADVRENPTSQASSHLHAIATRLARGES